MESKFDLVQPMKIYIQKHAKDKKVDPEDKERENFDCSEAYFPQPSESEYLTMIRLKTSK